MIELLIIILLAISMYRLAEKKGRQPIGPGVLVIALWIGGRFAGLWVAGLIEGLIHSSLGVLVFVLSWGVGGLVAAPVFWIVNRLPTIFTTEELNLLTLWSQGLDDTQAATTLGLSQARISPVSARLFRRFEGAQDRAGIVKKAQTVGAILRPRTLGGAGVDQ